MRWLLQYSISPLDRPRSPTPFYIFYACLCIYCCLIDARPGAARGDRTADFPKTPFGGCFVGRAARRLQLRLRLRSGLKSSRSASLSFCACADRSDFFETPLKKVVFALRLDQLRLKFGSFAFVSAR